MADQTNSPDDGGNPNPDSWVDPLGASSQLDPGNTGGPIKTDAELVVESMIAQRPDGYVSEEVTIEDDSGEDSTEDSEAGAEALKTGSKKKEASPAEPADEKRAADWLLKSMEKEAKFRGEREAFEKEKAEHQSQLNEFLTHKDLAAKDKIAFLKTLGVETPEQLQEFARDAYYESTGELAPDDYVISKKLKKQDREIAELKQAQTRKEEAEKSQQEQIANYQNSVVEQLQTADASAYPQIAEGFGKYNAEGVISDLMIVAANVENKTGRTPEAAELLPLLEAEYTKLFSTETQDESQPTQKRKAPSKTIRNKQTRAQATPTDITQYADGNGDLENYEKLAKASRTRALEEMRQAGLKV